MKKTLTVRVAALRPRNTVAAPARQRSAGAHTTAKRRQNDEQKDLLQRLREAGL
jgi:hypothetical protein